MCVGVGGYVNGVQTRTKKILGANVILAHIVMPLHLICDSQSDSSICEGRIFFETLRNFNVLCKADGTNSITGWNIWKAFPKDT